MDGATLGVNIGLFVVTAIATAVAWWQAVAAGRERGKAADASVKAQEAKTAAVAAQQAAAEALREANEIAREAKRLTELSEARRVERHSVAWFPHWDWEAGKWMLGNHGPDTAVDVRLSVESPTIGRVLIEEDRVEKDMALLVEFPMFAGQGGTPGVHWHVDWLSPLGQPFAAEGDWPE